MEKKQKEKEEKEKCLHNYHYSHQESRPNYLVTANELVDVVVCQKCGDVKRTPHD